MTGCRFNMLNRAVILHNNHFRHLIKNVCTKHVKSKGVSTLFANKCQKCVSDMYLVGYSNFFRTLCVCMCVVNCFRIMGVILYGVM